MSRQRIVFGLSVFVLVAATAIMFFSANADFSDDYRMLKILAVATLVITVSYRFLNSPLNRAFFTHAAFDRLLVVLAVIILAANNAFCKSVFMGSIEKFLFFKNQVLYRETASELLETGASESVELQGTKAKLDSGYTYVLRRNDYVAIYFSTAGVLARSRIIYTNDMNALKEEEGRIGGKIDVLDRNWCVATFGD